MTWRFDVVATEQERPLSRILQILEVQRVNIHSFTAEIDQAETRVAFKISSGQDKAYRRKALLHRLEPVESVFVTPFEEPALP